MNHAVQCCALLLLTFLTAMAQDIRFGAYSELRYARAIGYNASEEAALPEQEQCPNATGHVLFTVDAFGPNGPPITRDMGCCPVDYYGCWDDDVNQLLGCCPQNASVCCINKDGALVGCAEQVGQCCGISVCPTGYGCCSYVAVQMFPDYYLANQTGTVCCPTAPAAGDADDKDAYCEVLTIPGDPSDPADFPVSYPAGCLHSYEITLDYCAVNTVSCNASLVDAANNETVCNFCYNNTANCSVANPIKCAALSDCSYFLYNTTDAQLNATNVSSIDVLAGCCPPNLTLCMSPNNGYQVGCADTVAGYSCCGEFICPPLMKCCTAIGSANQTDYLGCCPEPTDCCMRNIIDPSATADVTDFFCGASFNGTACSVNKYAESRWFVLTFPSYFNETV